MAYSIEEAREKVIAAGLDLLKSGLIARTWGNVSARISDEEFIITPSGRAYESLEPADLAVVKIADGSYDQNGPRPSSEKLLHAYIYGLRPDADFIIHTHQNYATALSTMGETLTVPSEPDAAPEEASRSLLGLRVPTANYGLSGTRQLAKNVAEALKQNPHSKAVLMKNHGAVIFGRSYEEVFRAAHALEDLAETAYRELVGRDFPLEVTERSRAASADSPADLKKYMRFTHADIHEENYRWNRVFIRTGAAVVAECTSPFVLKMSEYGKTVPAYVDDMAQFAGPQVRCLQRGAGDMEAARAIGGSPGAVLIKWRGALVAASSEDEAEALLMVLEKNCRAALLAAAGNAPEKVGTAEGLLEHRFYVKKYSKRKDAVAKKGK
ncbi:MAG: class II aldolase/adducin family protein [Lachnospiraceae bacterium]|nr:class II aldolase/adducin family protein [Lachnospiraceae bacterium]